MAQTTTLGHMSALPVLIRDDAVIIDQQAHTSMNTALNRLRINGVPIEILRHHRLDLLEERIKELKEKHKHIWYLIDGVYSNHMKIINQMLVKSEI